jgi:16S rRNA (cytosine967-C5)-methyltransferase
VSEVTQAPALWQQLQACAQLLERILKGASATALLDAVPSALRPGVQAITYHVLRHLGQAQALRRALAPKTPKPAADALLLTALALMCVDDVPLYDAHTLVNQTSEAAKKHRATQALVPFLNGCLRRFLRERETLMAGLADDLQAQWNHPAWWVRRLQREQPERWAQVLTANNQAAPMTLRVNTRMLSREAYLAELAKVGLEAYAQGDAGLTLTRACPVHELPGFDQGWVSVQDAAAQLAAPLLLKDLHLSASSRVLDACAAPGGKTAHLLELSPAMVTALEVDAQRAQKIHNTLDRLKLQANVITADAAHTQSWWDGVLLDAILLDAPCTASGIVKRHPDVRWLRREADIEQLAAQQSRLLQALWPLLKVGGRLLYCTCSVFKAEGQDQTEAFLRHNTQARLLPSPGHLMPSIGADEGKLKDNQTHVHDGFYYALLEKVA